MARNIFSVQPRNLIFWLVVLTLFGTALAASCDLEEIKDMLRSTRETGDGKIIVHLRIDFDPFKKKNLIF